MKRYFKAVVLTGIFGLMAIRPVVRADIDQETGQEIKYVQQPDYQLATVVSINDLPASSSIK